METAMERVPVTVGSESQRYQSGNPEATICMTKFLNRLASAQIEEKSLHGLELIVYHRTVKAMFTATERKS
jgi:hypothetical protein